MKKLFTLISAVGLIMMLITSPVRAATINGEISMAGGFVPIGGSSLLDATAIDFLELVGGDLVSGTAGGTFSVYGVSGDFTGYVSPLSMGNINDFSFEEPFAPVTPLWEIGGFLFDLTTVTIVEQTSSTLILRGMGDVFGNGFDVSSGEWLLTANSFGSTFSWSASTVAPISESMTLILLSIGIFGLGLVIRRKNPVY